MIHQCGIPYHSVVWYWQEYVLVAAAEMIRSSAFMCLETMLRDHKSLRFFARSEDKRRTYCYTAIFSTVLGNLRPV